MSAYPKRTQPFTVQDTAATSWSRLPCDPARNPGRNVNKNKKPPQSAAPLIHIQPRTETPPVPAKTSSGRIRKKRRGCRAGQGKAAKAAKEASYRARMGLPPVRAEVQTAEAKHVPEHVRPPLADLPPGPPDDQLQINEQISAETSSASSPELDYGNPEQYEHPHPHRPDADRVALAYEVIENNSDGENNLETYMDLFRAHRRNLLEGFTDHHSPAAVPSYSGTPTSSSLRIRPLSELQ